MRIKTPLLSVLNIKYPIMLAGMGGPSRAEMTAAVSEAGGYGTLGGVFFVNEPDTLRQ